jgi:YbbR domain-containing protein
MVDGRFKYLLGKLGTMILAVLLASVIWIAATLQSDPFVTGELANLPIILVDQPSDTVIVEPIAERATVRVRAPQSVIQSLSMSDLAVTMNMAGIEVGKPVLVPVQVTTDNAAVRVEAVTPAQQAVYLEAVGSITVPVEIGSVGEVATGYQLLQPTISPDHVVVKGPMPALGQVSAVSGTLSVSGAREPIVASVAVAPWDANGNLVAGVSWTPEQIEVQVGVRKRLGFKPDVTVIPDLHGDPASGYRRGSVSVEPSIVTLAGLPSVLDELPGFVRTQPISVTGATGDVTARTTLTVPNGVMVVGAQYVTVTLKVLPIESSRIVTAAIEVQGLGPGMTASLSPDFVQVILVGPDTVLAGLKPNAIQVIVNLFGYGLGAQRVEPVVLAPEGVTVVSVIPQTVEVVISASADLTPTPDGPQ